MTQTTARFELPGFNGTLIHPGDSAYDEARKVFNGMIDRRPALIARCTCADDVAAAVNLAREQRLSLAVHGGGHGVSPWTAVAQNFRTDWGMLWKEITVGFFLAGFIGLLGNDFFNGLFIRHSDHVLRTIENVLLGPIVAVLSFVCSVGNIPLAAVLWSGGISFAAVLAFIFADSSCSRSSRSTASTTAWASRCASAR